jgi:hypothetical protein
MIHHHCRINDDPLPNETPNDARRLVEHAAVDGYHSNRLSRGQVRKMLGFTWSETGEFLAHHNCERHYDIAELEKDRQNLDRLLGH